MSKRMLQCPCGAAAEVNSSNVGTMHDQSGFFPIFLDTGDILWMCGRCTDDMRPHVGSLMALAGDQEKSMGWTGLRQMIVRGS